MKKVLLLLTGALLVLNTPVFAAEAPTTGDTQHKMLKQFDTDQDGKISREEFAAKRAKGFERIDTDKNGTVSLDEMKARCKNERCTQMIAKKFAKLDKNNDGNIGKDELTNMTMFDRLDKDKDGYISENELPGRRAKMQREKLPPAAPEMKKEGETKPM